MRWRLRLTLALSPLTPGADLRSDFQPQRIEPDKASRVVLVVSLGRIGLHGGNLRIVEANRALAARADDIALVELKPHGSGDIFLRLCDKRLERLALRSEPKAVVDQCAVLRDQANRAGA